MSKYSFKSFAVIFIFIFSLMTVSGLAKAQSELTLAIDEWPPFISKELPNNGPLSEIVRRAFEIVDIKVHYKYMPWKRAYESSARDLFDGTPGWGLNDDRIKEFYFSDPVLIQEEYLFYSKKNPINAETVDDLAGLKYGMVRGAMVSDELLPLHEKGDIKIVEHHSYEGLFKMMMLGRIDYISIGNFVGIKTLRQALPKEEWDQVGFIKHLTKPINYHLIIPRLKDNGPDLIETFNKGLQTLRDSGEYDTIIEAVYED